MRYQTMPDACVQLSLWQLVAYSVLASAGAAVVGLLVGAAVLGAHTPARARYEDAEGEP
jgi:hypothetical protein